MDLATAQTHLAAWLAVDLALTTGQSYTLPEMGVQRVDPRSVRERITYWQRIVDIYTASAAGSTSPAALATFGTVQ